MLVTLIHGYSKLDTSKEAYKYFLLAKSLIIFIMGLECITVILNGHMYSNYTVTFHKITNVIGFLLTPSIPFLYWAFLTRWLNIEKKYKLLEKIFILLIIINGVLSILSYRFNLIFNVQNNGVYERGPVFLVNTFICLVIILGCAYIILKNFRFLSREEKIVFILNLLIPVLLSVIQINTFKFLTIWSSCSIICILTYAFLLNDKSKKDPLTGLYNKQVYYDEINKALKRQYKYLTIINIDIDKFKSINDNFGHAEGDRALIELSSILYTTFKGIGKALRVGGDEFLVFLYESDPLKVEVIIDDMFQLLDRYNRTQNKPYNINISYGVKVVDSNNVDIHGALIECDKLMYKNKSKKAASK
ncbi:MAG: GGDEF domain-containing protein [Clostridium sp.]